MTKKNRVIGPTTLAFIACMAINEQPPEAPLPELWSSAASFDVPVPSLPPRVAATPALRVQSLAQESSLTLLPSSHSSPKSLTLSPHRTSGSSMKHEALQPSLPTTLPSS